MELAALNLTRKIAAAAGSSLSRLYKEFPQHDFFAYSIVAYPFLDSMSFCANSRQHFASTIASLNARERAQANYYKWSPEEWGSFEAYDNASAEWRAAEDQLRSELVDPFGDTIELALGTKLYPLGDDDLEANGAPAPTNERYVFSCMCEALRIIEARGEFRFAHRSEALTFVAVMGDPNPVRWHSALLLNQQKTSADLLDEFRNSCF